MKNTKRSIRKPSGFLWYFAGTLLAGYYRLFMCKFKSNKTKFRKKSLIISTHQSYYDFITVPYLTYPKRGNMVSTSYWFRNKKLAWVLNQLGVIKKNQYKSDITAIRQMSEVLKNDGIIYLFPEGQMTLDGRIQNLAPGIDKLIKKYKPNVYTVKANGAYLLKPKWATSKSKGSIDCEVNLILKEEEIDNYSCQEILSMVKKELTHDDVRWLSNHPEYRFTNRKKAEGIENLLYKCPKCGKEYTIIGKKSTIKCECCDFELTFKKNNYEFEENPYFKDFVEYFDYQKNLLKTEVLLGKTLKDKASLSFYESLDEVSIGECEVGMDLNHIYFKTANETADIKLHGIINFVITMGRSFEVPLPGRTYRIYPENGKASIKYKLLIDIIKEMEEENESNNQKSGLRVRE